ncbi:Protein of unknown function (DUF3494) domain containing protein [Hyaloscypha variabilis]
MLGFSLLIFALNLSFSCVQAYINLGSASTFGALSYASITNSGPTDILGDIGTTGSAIVGFPPGVFTGSRYTSSQAIPPFQAAEAAYTAVAALPGATLLVGNLGGQSLPPGVYKYPSSAQLSGVLTLAGTGSCNDAWYFQIGSTLTTSIGSSVVITGGSSGSVYWKVGTSATLGLASEFVGNILAAVSVNLNAESSVLGGVFALGASITLNSNTIELLDSCPSTPASSSSSSISSTSSSTSSAAPSSTSSSFSSSPPKHVKLYSPTKLIKLYILKCFEHHVFCIKHYKLRSTLNIICNFFLDNFKLYNSLSNKFYIFTFCYQFFTPFANYTTNSTSSLSSTTYLATSTSSSPPFVNYTTSSPQISSSVASSTQPLTTSTVYTTTVYTITKCPATVTNCPVGSVTTDIISLYTTICPVTPTPTPQPAPGYTASTIYTTKIYTITKCPATVTNCPVGRVTTDIISLYTTVCPVASQAIGNPAGPASTPLPAAISPGQGPPTVGKAPVSVSSLPAIVPTVLPVGSSTITVGRNATSTSTVTLKGVASSSGTAKPTAPYTGPTTNDARNLGVGASSILVMMIALIL